MTAKILCIVGARPNFMKMAPIMDALADCENIVAPLIHTGQHYDVAMNAQFFAELKLPKPDLDLGVGSGSHGVQTAEIMRRFEPVLEREQPQAILVVGDVNSTIACALVAVKMAVEVIHVEAGLRSFDRAMPEEINRLLTDQIAEVLFTTETAAAVQLAKEGIEQHRIHFVGNVMIDTLLRNLPSVLPLADLLEKLTAPADWAQKGYAVLTLHRPSNVDEKPKLAQLLETIVALSVELPIVFPVHPRCKQKIEDFSLQSILATPQILMTPPLGYLDMLGLNANASLVLTDSGGIQEETTALNIPCLTLRENTERPITVSEGTNTVVGTDAQRIKATVSDILQNGGKRGRVPQLWDGQTALRIAKVLQKRYT